jgi:NADH-ubiquinone oxidoreductase chain 1
MTEHAAVIFVFFFLAEYASIVLICILTSILFLGGYLYDILPFSIYSLYSYINFEGYLEYMSYYKIFGPDAFIEGLCYGLSLGLKSCAMIFVFI